MVIGTECIVVVNPTTTRSQPLDDLYMNGYFVLRMGMIVMPMEYLNEGVYKTPAAPPYSTLPQSTARYLLQLSTNCESVSFIRAHNIVQINKMY